MEKFDTHFMDSWKYCSIFAILTNACNTHYNRQLGSVVKVKL